MATKVATPSPSTGEIPTISPDCYISRDYVLREKEKLWPRVWQIACREEEIPSPGDYVTYDVADESIIVARTKTGEIVAYHNVCPHRGRRLTKGCGKSNRFQCGYHGWTFDLDGRNVLVQDRHDWNGGLDEEQLDLQHVRVDTWGGFVFIDMREEGESLTEYLEPVPENLGPYEYETMRYRWYLTINLPCNWKVAMEAFMENYHVAATHPQLLPYTGDDYSQSRAQGKHANFGFWESNADVPLGVPSPRLNQPWPTDMREAVMAFFLEYETNLKAIFSDRDYRATRSLMEDLPEGVDAKTAFVSAVELGRKAAEAEGAYYPEGVTWEHVGKIGADWHIFPNCVTLPWFDGALFYRSRPDGDDPDKCIFDIWSLVRYGPGKEPPLERKAYADMNGNSAGGILDQDIRNMGEVQKGMKSRAFDKVRLNPVQEVEIINFHHWLEKYLA